MSTKLSEFLSTSGEGRKLMQLRAGDHLFRKGQPAKHIHLILRGQVRLYHKARTIEFLGANRWLFEHAHELGHTHLQAAQAMEDSTIMAFEVSKFTALMSECADVYEKFMADTAERMVDRNHHTNEPADRRLARHFLELIGERSGLMVETSPLRLGERIGATRQRVDTLLKRFHAAQIVTRIGKKYRLDKVRLQQFLKTSGDGE